MGKGYTGNAVTLSDKEGRLDAVCDQSASLTHHVLLQMLLENLDLCGSVQDAAVDQLLPQLDTIDVALLAADEQVQCSSINSFL